MNDNRNILPICAVQITEALLGSGIDESQIGLISLYRQQNKLLAQALAARPNIEVLTADRSQGRDKDCIIVSMTRSNKRGDVSPSSNNFHRQERKSG